MTLIKLIQNLVKFGLQIHRQHPRLILGYGAFPQKILLVHNGDNRIIVRPLPSIDGCGVYHLITILIIHQNRCQMQVFIAGIGAMVQIMIKPISHQSICQKRVFMVGIGVTVQRMMELITRLKKCQGQARIAGIGAPEEARYQVYKE
jgi:hypothetical protein